MRPELLTRVVATELAGLAHPLPFQPVAGAGS